MEEKAYKLLAIQENISNSQAKALIDSGIVYVGNHKVKIARGMLSEKTKFRIERQEKADVIFEDKNVLVLNKPAFVVSEVLVKNYKGCELLHRLDKETSGVLVLVKNNAFKEKAIEEFRKRRVYKEYIAYVSGKLVEGMEINMPIRTKKGKTAKSHISYVKGQDALTKVEPLMLFSKHTKIKAIIETGRTHQIRIHMREAGHPILGDELYGGRGFKRIMLHSSKMKLFDYEFEAPEPKAFKKLEHNL